jgi:hypothetical protein
MPKNWDYSTIHGEIFRVKNNKDRFCGLVVRVPGYRSEGPGSIPEHYKKKKVVGLERGPLCLVSATEELLGSNSSGSGLENPEYGRRDSSR